jgi:hypothetical protein
VSKKNTISHVILSKGERMGRIFFDEFDERRIDRRRSDETTGGASSMLAVRN